MSASASDIEREVEASRANLEDTVEALKDKMSIGQMFDEATRYFGQTGGGEIIGKLGEQARANPLPLALVGIGLLWLMSGRGQPHLPSLRGFRGSGRSSGRYDYESLGEDEYRRTFGDSSVYAGASHQDYSSTSAGLDEDWDGSGDDHSAGGIRRRAHDLREAAGSAVSGAANVVGSAAHLVGSAASGLGHVASQVGRTAYSAVGSGADAALRGGSTAYRGASHLGSEAYSGISHYGSSAYYTASSLGRGARRTFADVLETEPLALGALGLAVGAAVGAFLPGTEAENRYLGETRDRLREEAEAFAREKYEQGKAVAQEALRTAKEEAEAQGLTTTGEDSIVGRVGQVARSTVERVRDSAVEKGLTGSSSGASSSSSSSGSSSVGGTSGGTGSSRSV